MEDNKWTYPFDKPHSWGSRDEQWYVRYLELKAYKKIHGDCKVPKAWKPNHPLARWVSRQRREKQNMPDWRKRLLDQLKFTWRIAPPLTVPPKSWEQHYQELVTFKQQHGHADVPHSWPENRRLAKWVGAQRGFYKKGELETHKIQQLEEIGFSWVLQIQTILPWDEYFQRLKIFKQTSGHCNVPSTFEDKKLAKWVARQRKIVDSISQTRKEKLDSIGFKWRLRPERLSWDARYEQLLEFKDKNGHCNVSTSDLEEWQSLISWVQEQRRKYKESSLSHHQIIQLEKVGFVWSALEDVWMQSYEQLCVYKEENGHCFPSIKDPVTKSLGLWVRTQRLMESSLSPRRLELLNKIGFDWEQEGGRTREQWMRQYQSLKEYKSKHGHFIIPRDNLDLKSLRTWFFIQRSKYKKGILDLSRIKLLDALGVEWRGDSRFGEIQWMKNYQLLKEFKDQHGHFKIPKNKEYRSLGDWLFYQRKKFKQGKLNQSLVDLLDQLGSEWKITKGISPNKK